MKKSIMTLLAIFFVFGSQSVLASVDDVDCFKYYKFQDGLLFDDINPMKYSYKPADEVFISYDLLSLMDSPVVEGKVRVQVLYEDPSEGEQIVDEFIAYEDVNLMPKDRIKQEFRWTIPLTAKSGRYIVKTYFIVGESLNLAGLSFVPYGPPGVPGGMTFFEVENTYPGSRIYFSKEETYVNDEKYPFGAFLSSRESEPLEIKTKLVNEGPAKQVHLSLNVYEWDDVTDEPLKDYSVEKDISLEANGVEDITFSLPGLEPATYQLKFIAEYSDGKSILKLRISISGAKGRFIYLGMDRFPLIKNEETTVFFCLSNSADYLTTFTGRGTVELTDDAGNSILKEAIDPFEVVSKPMGKKLQFTPDREITDATLRIDLYDDEGNFMDEVQLKYSYSKFPNIAADLDLEIDKTEYKAEETLTYTITYKDDKRRPLAGKILLYVLDPNDVIVYMISDKEIIGSLTGNVELPGKEGNYKIIARELTHDMTNEALFTVEETLVTTAPTTLAEVTTSIPETEEPKADHLLLIAVVIIIILIIAVFLRRRT